MSKQILSRLDEFDPQWITLQVPTLTGQLKEVHISREKFNESTLESGFPIEDLFKSKVILVPRLESYAEVPWYPRTVRFFSKLREPTGVRHPMDVYYPVEKITKKLDIHIKTHISFHILEGFTLDKVTKERGPSVSFDSKEGRWNPTSMPTTYMSSFPADAYYGVRQQIADLLKLFGYSIEKHHHGLGTSQQVISFDAMDAVKSAEAIVSLKYVSRAISPANNVNISFMPYIIPNEPGNNLKLELLGFIEDGELSQEGRYFIGGVLEHYKSLLLFTNPTTNSYKRFLNESYFRAWGKGVPGVMVSVENQSVVLSFPDAIANPYLLYASILAAGADGIKHTIDPGDPVNMSPRLLSSTEKKRKKIYEFPKDLFSVIESIESDNEYLKTVFPTELIIDIVEKKYRELREEFQYPSISEFEKYFYL